MFTSSHMVDEETAAPNGKASSRERVRGRERGIKKQRRNKGDAVSPPSMPVHSESFNRSNVSRRLNKSKLFASRE